MGNGEEDGRGGDACVFSSSRHVSGAACTIASHTATRNVLSFLKTRLPLLTLQVACCFCDYTPSLFFFRE
jgi:hypothetical protein